MEFAYDYQGRRIEKKVYTYNGSVSETRRFVWDDWLLLLELTDAGGSGFQPVRKLTWGRELGSLGGSGSVGVPAGNDHGGPASGRSSLDSAGGIGGLLAM